MLFAAVIEFDIFAAIFLLAGLVVVCGLWFFYERREAVLSDHRRINTVFHCVKCQLIYARPRRRENTPCPRCGFNNVRLKF
ncbi:MAG: hypothetical protein LBV28_01395 [Puniceicoccales bacterium]|nr:hypothetical protein [Puniceicoccales bacterium]